MRATAVQKQTAASLAGLTEQLAEIARQIVIVHQRLDDVLARIESNAEVDAAETAEAETQAVRKRKQG